MFSKEGNTSLPQFQTDWYELLYAINYTDADIKNAIRKGKDSPTKLWIKKMLDELEKNILSIDERVDMNKALAEEANARNEKEIALRNEIELETMKLQEVQRKKELKRLKEKQIEGAKKLLQTNAFTDEQIIEIIGIDRLKLEELKHTK